VCRKTALHADLRVEKNEATLLSDPATLPTTSFALDTDIGTDVDDLLALALILGSDDAEVPLVTTVYGDVELRARIASKAYASAGRPAPRIVPGLAETLSGRDVWWPGHEGSTIADLDLHVFTAGGDAVRELAATDRIVAIGPLTNVAAAVHEPGPRIAEIMLMGGEFTRGIVEHNIRCDVTAAQRTFGSTATVTVIGLEQTERVRLEHADLDLIASAGALGELLAAEMQRFWEFAAQDYNVPHDPLAVLAVLRPELFAFETGTIAVADDGVTSFTPSTDGRHRIVTDMDVPAVASQIRQRILAGAAASSAIAG
jgi:purine nucleosidase